MNGSCPMALVQAGLKQTNKNNNRESKLLGLTEELIPVF